jgi:hypothetical protein
MSDRPPFLDQPAYITLRHHTLTSEQVAELSEMDKLRLQCEASTDNNERCIIYFEWLREMGEFAARHGLNALPSDPAGAIREECRQLRALVERLENDGVEFQPEVNALWNLWDERFPDRPLSSDPRRVTTHQEAKNAVNLVLRELNGLTPSTPPLAGEPAQQPPPPAAATPTKYLFGWAEVLSALKQPNDETWRERVRRLNELHGGPILVTGQGGQPRVAEPRLIEWWNSLERRFEESVEQERDRKASVEAQHHYGRDGTVVPEIDGAVKKRRTPKR